MKRMYVVTEKFRNLTGLRCFDDMCVLLLCPTMSASYLCYSLALIEHNCGYARFLRQTDSNDTRKRRTVSSSFSAEPFVLSQHFVQTQDLRRGGELYNGLSTRPVHVWTPVI
jgi:hypothetical protein